MQVFLGPFRRHARPGDLAQLLKGGARRVLTEGDTYKKNAGADLPAGGAPCRDLGAPRND